MHVMFHEIRTTLGRKMFTIIGFGIPAVLGIVAIVLILTNRDKAQDSLSAGSTLAVSTSAQIREGYVDEAELIQYLPAGVSREWLIEYQDQLSAQQAVDDGRIEGYYIIPADYKDSGELTYVRATFSIIGDQVNSNPMEWILPVNLLGDSELGADIWKPLNVKATSMRIAAGDAETVKDSWIAEMFPTLMTLMLYMAIIISSSVLVAAVTDEKKNRVMEVLLSSVSPGQMITGKLLAVGFLGMLLLGAWIVVFLIVAIFGGASLNIPADFSVPVDVLVWAVVFGFFGYAMYGALMAGLGALAPDVKDTRSAAVIVLAPLIVAYMLMMFIYTTPDGPVSLALSLFPLTSPVGMIGRMAVTDVPMWQSLLAVFFQLLAAIVIVRLVIKLFRAQTLLSGQDFETRRYVNALLGRGQ